MDVKPLHDFKKVAEPNHTRKKWVLNTKSLPLAQEALCHEREGLWGRMAACLPWSHCLPGPDGDSDSDGTLHWVDVWSDVVVCSHPYALL